LNATKISPDRKPEIMVDLGSDNSASIFCMQLEDNLFSLLKAFGTRKLAKRSSSARLSAALSC